MSLTKSFYRPDVYDVILSITSCRVTWIEHQRLRVTSDSSPLMKNATCDCRAVLTFMLHHVKTMSPVRNVTFIDLNVSGFFFFVQTQNILYLISNKSHINRLKYFLMVANGRRKRKPCTRRNFTWRKRWPNIAVWHIFRPNTEKGLS